MLVQSCVLLKQNDSIFIYMSMFHPATHTLSMCQQKQTHCTAGAQGNNYSTNAPAVVNAQFISARSLYLKLWSWLQLSRRTHFVYLKISMFPYFFFCIRAKITNK